MFQHNFKQLEFPQKQFRYTSCFQLSSRCLKYDETLFLMFDILLIDQGPVVLSMVSANHWLSSIKINRLPWYLTLVSANQASSNSALVVNDLL